MRKIIYLFAGLSFLISCEEKKTENTDPTVSSTTPVEKAKPVYAYPVKYADWEIGNPEYTKIAIDFYYYWDRKEMNKVAGLFSDTLTIRIPTDRNEIVVPNNQINEALTRNRGMYDSTSNSIMSAVALHDKESNEDWVMITTYNKWVQKDGTRDSVLYHDNWKIKNGKLSFLMSFDKVPTKQFIKKNEK